VALRARALQILCAVPDIFDSIFPSPFRGFLGTLGLPALSFPLVSLVGCAFSNTDYYTQLLASTLVPWGLIFLVYGWFAVSYLRLRRESRARARANNGTGNSGSTSTSSGRTGSRFDLECHDCGDCFDCSDSDGESSGVASIREDGNELTEKQQRDSLRSK
jgi:hypothetical protein